MKIHRFYIGEYKGQENYSLDSKDLVNQIYKVLKMKVGESVILFNGTNNIDYVCEILSVANKKIDIIQKSCETKDNTINKNIDLYLAIPKSGIEDILRACTELGVSNIYPVISERTEKKELNIERLNKIIIEACEQSGRNTIPGIYAPVKLKDVNTSTFENSVVYHTSVPQSYAKASDCKPVTQDLKNIENIFAGPEGGFTESEIKYLADRGARIKKLSTYTLRTVTAAPICLFDAMQGI